MVTMIMTIRKMTMMMNEEDCKRRSRRNIQGGLGSEGGGREGRNAMDVKNAKQLFGDTRKRIP